MLLIIIILYKKIVSKESNDIELYKYHRDELAYALLIYLQCYPKEEKISILKFHEQLERFNYLIMPEKDLLQKRMASILESTVSSTTRIWIDYLSFFFENLLKDGSIVLEELILQFSFFFVSIHPSISLLYIKQAPILVECFQLLIKERNEIYSKVQTFSLDDNYPNTIHEFLSCKIETSKENNNFYFNEWWKLFYIQDQNFLKYLSNKNFFKEYFQILTSSKSIEEFKSTTICNIILTDSISISILQNEKLLSIFFQSLLHHYENEYFLFYFSKIFVNLIKIDIFKISSFLMDHKNLQIKELFIHKIYSGNIFYCIKKFIQFIGKSLLNLNDKNKKNNYLLLIFDWLSMLFSFLFNNENSSSSSSSFCKSGFYSCFVSNSCDVLSFILQDSFFLNGSIGNKILNFIDNFSIDFINKTLSNDNLELALSLQQIIKNIIIDISSFTTTNDNNNNNGFIDSNNNSVISNATIDMNQSNTSPLISSISSTSISELDENSPSDTDDDEILMESHFGVQFHESKNDNNTNKPLTKINIAIEEEIYDEFTQDSPETSNINTVEELAPLKMKLISLLFENSTLVKNLLESKDSITGNFPIKLGVFRFSLIELIATIVLSNISTFDQFLINSNWLSTIFDLFFYYKNHSILQNVIYNLVKSIVTRSNSTFLTQVLASTSLLDRIAQEAKKKKNNRASNFTYMILIIQVIYSVAPGKLCIENNPNAKTLCKIK